MRMKMMCIFRQALVRSLSSSAAAQFHKTLTNTHARSDLVAATRIFNHAAVPRSSFHSSAAFFSDASRVAAAGVCRSLGNLGIKLCCTKLRETVSPPYLMGCRGLIHSGSPKGIEAPRNGGSWDFVRDSVQESRKDLFQGSPFNRPGTETNAGFGGSHAKEFGVRRNARSMDFVREVVQESKRDLLRGSQFTRSGTGTNADIVHIKLLKNNTFVTLTDSMGNRKAAASAGVFKGKKSGSKKSRFASETTAEHIGRVARNLGTKSVVMKVNGFTFFKKKSQAMLSWKDGYTEGRGDHIPVVYLEDTTRLPHNGCRLRKKRSV